ncbi:hypothetical protein ACLB2K_043153 [Fragaria x ananassa]
MSSSNPNSHEKLFEGVRNSATGIHTVSTNPHPAQYHDNCISMLAAQPYHHFPPPIPEPWKSGICDCFSDMNSCCLTFFCPCITFGQIAEIVDKGSISCAVSGVIYTAIYCLIGCACIYSCLYRSKLRHQYSLEEKPCYDCFVHFFCESCALCQEHRELQSRGFNMAIAWRGNIDGRNYNMAMAPVPPRVEGGMSRI